MSIYDDIMGDVEAAPGVGPATRPPDFGGLDPDDFLPEPEPGMYDQIWGTVPTGEPEPTYGAGERGPAARQEDIGAVGGTAGKIVRAARSLIGTPYVWGGTSQTGVDCSGLIQIAYKAAGISLPRVSYQQANYGRRVAVGALRPGDLVAWDNSSRNPGADHIALYIGGGRIIEAARPGTRVQVRKISNDEGAWGVRIIGSN